MQINRRIKKYMGVMALTTALFTTSIKTEVYAAQETAEETAAEAAEVAKPTDPELSPGCALEDGAIEYIALGDSIPNGYCATGEAEVTAYPDLLAEDLRELGGDCVGLAKYTKNGLSAKKMNKTTLNDEAVLEELERADVVTVTIGANDLMNEFKKTAREILHNESKFSDVYGALEALQDGISENPLLLIKCAQALGGWDYASFEEEWIDVMETLNTQCPAQCQIVVTTIYNPVEQMELPGTLNAVVETVISKMNETICDYAEIYDYQVVDLFDSGIGECTQSDGLHPNQEGQDMIHDLIVGQLDLDAFSNEKLNEAMEAQKQKEMEEAAKAAAEKAAKAKAEEQKQTLRRIGFATAAICIAAMIVVFCYRKKKRV